jgi:citrate lyase subunit beta / citryl-CoA lyase
MMPVPRPYRARRSCLAVPASSERFIAKARGLAADEVFLDLEDAVAPAAKTQARVNAAAAVAGDWGGRTVAVRVNDACTQ